MDQLILVTAMQANTTKKIRVHWSDQIPDSTGINFDARLKGRISLFFYSFGLISVVLAIIRQ